MTVKIYLANLASYVEGRENGRWLQLPMQQDKLQAVYNSIVGENQEHIILDYTSPFDISEYENIFDLNNSLESLSECGLDDNTLEAIFKFNPDFEEVTTAIENGDFDIVNVDEVSEGWSANLAPEELFGMVLNETGFNNLFSQPIPEEMIDYIDFGQIFTCLSVNDGWEPIVIDDTTTYLVRLGK